MTAQIATSVENNFTKGLITEATGLNFPENAATDTSNCIYTLVGDVTRREGINFEANGTTFSAPVSGLAQTSYVWNNPGGDGNSRLLVKQIGNTLYFYNIATATTASPLSTQILTSSAGASVTISNNVPTGGTFDATQECTFSDGNGWLFVYHPSCDPGYVTYNAATQSVALNTITLQIRDFYGLNDGLSVNTRPTTLSTEHNYNIQNQGWTTGNSLYCTSQTQIYSAATGAIAVTTQSGLGSLATNGLNVTLTARRDVYYLSQASGPVYVRTLYDTASGTVTSYSGTTLTLNVTSQSVSGSFSPYLVPPCDFGGDGVTWHIISGVDPNGQYYYTIDSPWTISSKNTSTITTWFNAEGNYPSNADVWWYFKDSSGTFSPSTTQPNVTLSTGNAPQGHYVLPAFNMDRSLASGVAGITAVTTSNRPTNGCWFQGRVWYTGCSASFAKTGDVDYYTWSENIYFSQVVTTTNDFGLCYQTNDPTSENLNSLLPTDGGVITIPGTGTIHRLWPVANGMLVFANNGVWFITGSQGIGFAANDYTITQISHSPVLSYHSFVDVLGLPFYWNEDGIYQTSAGQNGSLAVNPITVGTILTYYNTIPLASKKYARGAYDPINFIIQWAFKTTQEASVTDRYQFDSILNYNTYNKAFYPYAISSGSNTQYIHGIDYVSYPYISTVTPDPGFKYHCSSALTNNGFAEEYDTSYLDWGSVDYTSYFVTGYKVHGKGLMRFQIPYLYLYARNTGYSSFTIQSIWDFGTKSSSTSKWSQPQFIEINEASTDVSYRRIRLRGRGLVMQIKVTSTSGQPFDLMGWAVYEVINAGV